MRRARGLNAILAGLAAILLIAAAAPAATTPPPAPAAATAAAETSHPAADADIPVTDMAWPTGEGDMAMDHGGAPKTFQARLVAWLGMWHPAAVHFPIALLLTVAVLEAAAAVRRKPVYAASAKLLLGLAAASAFAAAPLGWLNAGLPAADDGGPLTLHRWLGTALPFLLLGLWALKRPADQAARRLSSGLYGTGLALLVLLILVQAYNGAVVTHGAEHMRF
ncbi:MAG: DUF2231 domain-containing protein [Pseudomonadota bacterium]